MERLSDFGMIGLAVMGENLALNIESKGFYVSVFNRTIPGIEEGVAERFVNGRGKDKNFFGTDDLQQFVESIERPRKIMMMVKAGEAIDQLIEQLLPLLDKGDVIIDGGNSHFPDSNRRTQYLEENGLYFIGAGVSGGEEGALTGPSVMPGGSKAAWPLVKPVMQAIAAKTKDGEICCDWVGDKGAGHFVKMVHNGIEYGDMQLISEIYHLMKDVLCLSPEEMSEVFTDWNKSELESYLVEITGNILAHKDVDGLPTVDKILDKAGQKGTGKWVAMSALDLGAPLTLIAEAVFGRCLSAMKDERVTASKVYAKKELAFQGNKKEFITDLRNALYAAKIASYAQGYMVMKMAAKEYQWDLNFGGIALMWRGGCIIRSAFLGKIKEAFDNAPEIPNLLLDPFFKEKIEKAEQSWRNVVSMAIAYGIPVPALASSLTYFDGYRSEHLPANLLQAQRDYFGAHTYERVDKPRGEYFHTNWTGAGGDTASSTYNV